MILMNTFILILLSKLIADHATDLRKQSSSLPLRSQTIPEQEIDPKVRTVDKQSHEEGEMSPENGTFVNNGHETRAELSKPAKQHAYSDDSNHNRCVSPLDFLSI